MLFGLKNAGQTFQRMMDEILSDLDFLFVYMDDILPRRAHRTLPPTLLPTRRPRPDCESEQVPILADTDRVPRPHRHEVRRGSTPIESGGYQ